MSMGRGACLGLAAGLVACGGGSVGSGPSASGGSSGVAGAAGTAGAAGAIGGGSPAGSGGVGGGGPEPRSGELLALTYNVAGLPEGLSGSNPSVNTPYISPHLDDYDLVVVQEDWKEPSPNLLALLGYHVYHDLLAAQAHHPYQSTPMPLPQGTDLSRPTALVSDGLNYFSAFPFPQPIVRVRWTGCFGDANTGAADCLAEKGFALARMTLAEGADVDVITLHGEAGSTPMDQPLQAADFQQLASYIVASAAGHAILLGGDTNLHTETGEDRAIWTDFLAASGLIDVCQTLDCGADADAIDKFAFRSRAGLAILPLSHHFEREKFVRPTDGQPLSDHDALAVRFRWTLAP